MDPLSAPPSPAPAPGPVAPPPEAPSNQLTLDPNLTSKARGEHACKPGDTYKTTITVKATDKGSFDVVDIEPFQAVSSPVGPVDDPTVLNEDEEEKALGYKRPQRSMSLPEVG
jgi:hypothetical protein